MGADEDSRDAKVGESVDWALVQTVSNWMDEEATL